MGSPVHRTDGLAMLMNPKRANSKQLFMAANCPGMWLCACVKYWPYRGVGTCASVLIIGEVIQAVSRQVTVAVNLQKDKISGSEQRNMSLECRYSK